MYHQIILKELAMDPQRTSYNPADPKWIGNGSIEDLWRITRRSDQQYQQWISYGLNWSKISSILCVSISKCVMW